MLPRMVDKTEFGATLKRLREKRGLSIRDLSDYSNLWKAAVGQYESGHKPRPSRRTVEKLGAGLGLSRSEMAELLRSAGHSDRGVETNRASLEVFLQGDPDLTSDQRQILLATYHAFVRSNRRDE